MEQEKTLLQQIRDKEQEFSKTIELVKHETDTEIAAAGAKREKALHGAEQTGKNSAEELYLREKLKTDTQIERMIQEAAAETEQAKAKGERNLQSAVEKIVSYVIME
jgi:vacuolar-type H+-ATPase subunit H